jgi:hypothetical protein
MIVPNRTAAPLFGDRFAVLTGRSGRGPAYVVIELPNGRRREAGVLPPVFGLPCRIRPGPGETDSNFISIAVPDDEPSFVVVSANLMSAARSSLMARSHAAAAPPKA